MHMDFVADSGSCISQSNLVMFEVMTVPYSLDCHKLVFIRRHIFLTEVK